MNQPFPFTVHPPPPTDELEPFLVTERRKEHIEELKEKVSILKSENREMAKQMAEQRQKLALLESAGRTSPYVFFVKMCYDEHKKKFPKRIVQATEILWKTMTQHEKQRFVEMAKKDAERYQTEVAGKRKRGQDSMDPPRRPLSAFLCFSDEKWSDVQQDHPEWRVAEVEEELERQWKDVTEVEKKKYEEMATKDKARYESEMREYKAGGGCAGEGKKPAGRAASTSAEGGYDE